MPITIKARLQLKNMHNALTETASVILKHVFSLDT